MRTLDVPTPTTNQALPEVDSILEERPNHRELPTLGLRRPFDGKRGSANLPIWPPEIGRD